VFKNTLSAIFKHGGKICFIARNKIKDRFECA